VSKKQILFEAFKIVLACFFLYLAFMHTTISEPLMKATRELGSALLIVLAYALGRRFSSRYEEWWKNYLLVFVGISAVTVIYWAGIGTHMENGDPMYGGGDTVVDFIPTNSQRSNLAVEFFVTYLVASTVGVYSARRDM